MAKFFNRSPRSFTAPALDQLASTDKPLQQEEQVVYLISPSNYLRYREARDGNNRVVLLPGDSEENPLPGDGVITPPSNRRRGTSRYPFNRKTRKGE